MIHITLVWSAAPRSVQEHALDLPEGSTAGDALKACADALAWVKTGNEEIQPGIWGRAAEWDAALDDGDRIELCRPLKVDPKVARRERFARQGARGTGLFARQRAGGKAGY